MHTPPGPGNTGSEGTGEEDPAMHKDTNTPPSTIHIGPLKP